MGVSLYWTAIAPSDQHLNVGLRSAFVEQMRQEFGDQPWKLRWEDIAALRRVELHLQEGDRACIDTLCEAIKTYKQILVEAIY